MEQIIDFSKCPYSNRHGTYGGKAGDKDGIIFNNEFWIVKYPKSTVGMTGIDDMPYTTSPLSEYLGSHIYQLLGIPVHETLLGVRNGKLIVACKDFCSERGSLLEMRTIKNAANSQLSELLEIELIDSTSGDRVNLNELFLHLKSNPILKMVSNLEMDRFWKMVLVDVFIGNNDRNNGNWGLLFNEKNLNPYSIAPVYDNGNAFSNKTSDSKIESLYKTNRVQELCCGERTIYEYNGKLLSAKKLLKLDNENLKDAIYEMTPVIKEKLPEIISLIQTLPNEYNGIPVISDIRKRFYSDALLLRYEVLIEPLYNQILVERGLDNDSIDPDLDDDIDI